MPRQRPVKANPHKMRVIAGIRWTETRRQGWAWWWVPRALSRLSQKGAGRRPRIRAAILWLIMGRSKWEDLGIFEWYAVNEMQSTASSAASGPLQTHTTAQHHTVTIATTPTPTQGTRKHLHPRHVCVASIPLGPVASPRAPPRWLANQRCSVRSAKRTRTLSPSRSQLSTNTTDARAPSLVDAARGRSTGLSAGLAAGAEPAALGGLSLSFEVA